MNRPSARVCDAAMWARPDMDVDSIMVDDAGVVVGSVFSLHGTNRDLVPIGNKYELLAAYKEWRTAA